MLVTKYSSEGAMYTDRPRTEERDGDDLSLSDLSISDPDLDDELEAPAASEPSTWAEVRGRLLTLAPPFDSSASDCWLGIFS